MPELTFQIDGVEAVPFAASPELALKLNIRSAAAVQNVLLQSQIQIEPALRQYEPDEQEALVELFGEPARWGQTLRPLIWTNAHVVVPAFDGETSVNVPLPCTFDFNVAATKYFYGVRNGSVPLTALFSGSIFYWTSDRRLQVAQISWNCEARHLVPVQVWREMMDRYYPNTAWMALRRDIFDQVRSYKMRHGFTTLDQAFEAMLAASENDRAARMPV